MAILHHSFRSSQPSSSSPFISSRHHLLGPKNFAGHNTVEESTLYILESHNSQGFLVQVVAEREVEARFITPLNRFDETIEPAC